MTDTYIPKPGTLPARMCEYFIANPDEELTRADVAAKFEVAGSSIDGAISSAVVNGMIATKNNEEMMRVWIAGANLPRKGFKGWLQRKGQKSSEGRPPPAALPEPDAIVIEKGVPLAVAANLRTRRYEPIFAKMEIGDSFGVSREAAKKLISAAHAFAKPLSRKFALRQLDESTSRIWRTE